MIQPVIDLNAYHRLFLHFACIITLTLKKLKKFDFQNLKPSKADFLLRYQSCCQGVIMPIGGVVITSFPHKKDTIIEKLSQIKEIEIHGDDEQGNIVAVLDTVSSEEMEKIIDRINKDESVLSVGMTYLNTEDEAERMNKGERLAKPFGFRKPIQKDE